MRFSMVINIRLTSDGLVQMFLFTLTTSLRPVALVYNSLLLSRVVIKGFLVGYGHDSNSYLIKVMHGINPIKLVANVTFLRTMKYIEEFLNC